MQNGTEHYSPAFEHEYLQEHMVLNGVNAASAWVWDLTVLTDFMASQPTLFDPERIGVAGCSGGGVQTAYLGAMDDRIVAASIACYSSTIRVDYAPSGIGGGGGPAEGEQQWGPSMVGGAALLDKPDLLQIRAPKPTQVLLTTRDQYFPLVGGEAAVAESMPAFEALAEKGAAPALTSAVGNNAHGYVNATRLAMYAFLSETMLHANDSGVELDGPTPAFDFSDMRVTSTGSVLTAPEINNGKGSVTMHQAFSVPITTARLASLKRRREADGKGFLATVAASAAEVVGFRLPAKPIKAGVYGNFDIILGHLSRGFRPYATPRALCACACALLGAGAHRTLIGACESDVVSKLGLQAGASRPEVPPLRRGRLQGRAGGPPGQRNSNGAPPLVVRGADPGSALRQPEGRPHPAAPSGAVERC